MLSGKLSGKKDPTEDLSPADAAAILAAMEAKPDDASDGHDTGKCFYLDLSSNR